MKYYLNESIKYILSEQFVLNEAIKHSDLIVQCKTIYDYIKKLLNELENGTDDTNAKENALNKIFDRTTSLMQDTRKVNDVEIIKGKAKDYINTIQSLITIIDPSTFNDSITADNKTTAFGKFFAHLNELIEKSDVKKSELTSELSKIDTVIQAAMDGLANITNNATETKTKDDQIVALTKAYKLIYKVSQASETEYDNNESISETIEGLSDALKKVTEAKNDEAKNNARNNFITLCEEITKGDIAELINNLTVDNYSQTGLETSLSNGIDWAKEYKNTPDKELFWNKYYNGVWGKNADKIKSLGESFKQECAVLGFTEATNPFIAFIKKYYTEDAEMQAAGKSAAGYYIDIQHYEAIHNAIAENKLLKRDITNNPKEPITVNNNIIFYRDFYAKPGNEAKIYIDALSKLRNMNIKNLVLENKTVQTNLIACSNGDNELFIAAVLTNKVPLKDLLADKANLSLITPTRDDKLRPVQDLEQLLTLMNANDTNKEVWNSMSTDKLIAGIKETFKGEEAKYAKWIICYIANSQETDDAKINKLKNLNNTYKWFNSFDSSLDVVKKVKIITELNRYGGNIDWKMLDNIIKAFEKEEDPAAKGKSWLDTPIKS